MTVRIRPLLLALAVVAATAAAAGARAQAPDPRVAATLRRVEVALAEEDAAAAQGLVQPLVEARADDPAVLAAAGLVRFYQQRYAEAAELLERAGPAADPEDLGLARAGRDITRDHARAQSEHFVVSYPKGKDEVLVPYLLEALEAQRRALQQDMGWASSAPLTIEILNDTRELSRLSTLSEEEIKNSGTIALCKFNKLMIVSPKALVRGYDWLDTAAHEYTHHVVTARTHNRAPVWLQEGIAKYSESRWRGPGGEVSGYAASLLRRALQQKQLVTFAQMHPSLAKLPHEQAALAFVEVELAVAYLQTRGGQALMNRVLDLVEGGASAEDAVARALGVGFDAFQAAWLRFMAARPLPPDAEEEALRFKGDPKHGGAHAEWAELPDERARGYARLGEIFRERGRWAPARLEYGKAVARVGRSHAVLSDKFALAAMMTGHDAEAEAALREAMRRHPGYAGLHLHLARLELKRKRWAPARAELLLANAVDPFDPEIHAGLALALTNLGDAEGAARERRFAQLLAAS